MVVITFMVFITFMGDTACGALYPDQIGTVQKASGKLSYHKL